MKKLFTALLLLAAAMGYTTTVYAGHPDMVHAGVGRILEEDYVDDDDILGDVAGEAVNEKHVEASHTVNDILDIHEEIPEGSVISDEELHRREALALVTGTAVDDGTIAGYVNLGIAKVDNWLNVREKPAEDAELVGKMPKNAGCEILEQDGEWAHIKSGKVNGWSKLEFLYTGDEARAKAEEVITLMATVTTTTLYVREAPSTESSVITMVPMEEELEVVEDLEGWCKITIDDDEGYISKDYVNLAKKLERAVTMKELKYGQGVSDVRVSMVNYAKQFLGNRYVWGGTSLTNGTDCSGFTMGIYRKFGISLPRVSRSQATVGTKIGVGDLKPGDLVFYGKGSYINHVAMYIGGGQIIHASSPKTGIKISNVRYRSPITCRRIIKD
ncbi:MAG: C40 family peptidase [Lachnospiraceae bacterium]|nr:C40 family peptidase [Lachnospiraceae bacterium]